MRKLLFPAILAFALSSCNSVLVCHMDVLSPGYFVTSPDKDSVLLVDNSGIQPSGLGHSVLELYRYKKDTSFNTEPLSGSLLKSVSENLLRQGSYNDVRICSRLQNGFARFKDFKLATLLTNPQVRALNDSVKAKLLISLDRLVVMSLTNVYPYEGAFRSTRDVKVNTVWSVIDLSPDSLVSHFQCNDSLYWEKFADNPSFAVAELPALEKCLPEIGDYVGGQVSRYLGVHWDTVDRYYFSSGSYRMKYAVDCLRNNDWEKAGALWKEEYERGFGRSVYRAAMNMMLYAEYTGNPMDALAWSVKAEDAIKRFALGPTEIDSYILEESKAVLQTRAADYEKLKMYLIPSTDSQTGN